MRRDGVGPVSRTQVADRVRWLTACASPHLFRAWEILDSKNGVSVAAGIEEELIYRGFLFAYLAAWLPDVPAVVVIVLAGFVFGLGHLYQGASGIVKTGVLGVLFGVLYWMTGSLWAPMLLHIVVDLSSG